MKTYTKKELKKILNNHYLWLKEGKKIGRAQGYTNLEIKLYLEQLKMIRKVWK